MTSAQVPVDDSAEIKKMLSASDALLLDFDGPVCSVFANHSADVIASRMQSLLADIVDVEIPEKVRRTSDPFEVLRFATNIGTAEAERIHSGLRDYELEAVASAEPTLGAHGLIRTWKRHLAIVSNNSTVAVSAYLEKYSLTQYVNHVSGRESQNLYRLKPAPYLVSQAVEVLAVKSGRTILIGDSVTDIVAAQEAGCKSVGYANKVGKMILLKSADAIVTTMNLVADAAVDFRV